MLSSVLTNLLEIRKPCSIFPQDSQYGFQKHGSKHWLLDKHTKEKICEIVKQSGKKIWARLSQQNEHDKKKEVDLLEHINCHSAIQEIYPNESTKILTLPYHKYDLPGLVKILSAVKPPIVVQIGIEHSRDIRYSLHSFSVEAIISNQDPNIICYEKGDFSLPFRVVNLAEIVKKYTNQDGTFLIRFLSAPQ